MYQRLNYWSQLAFYSFLNSALTRRFIPFLPCEDALDLMHFTSLDRHTLDFYLISFLITYRAGVRVRDQGLAGMRRVRVGGREYMMPVKVLTKVGVCPCVRWKGVLRPCSWFYLQEQSESVLQHEFCFRALVFEKLRFTKQINTRLIIQHSPAPRRSSEHSGCLLC